MINHKTHKLGPKICPHCKAVTYFTHLNKFSTDPIVAGSADKFLNVRVSVTIYECDGCSKKEIHFSNNLGKDKILWPIKNRTLDIPEEISSTLPLNLIKDFDEAASIESLSPNASATLSRRCLQSIITSKFPELVKGKTKLKQQVNSVISAGVLPSYITIELHGIRSVGNNGAHANLDPETNEIIEVDSKEAAECLDAIQSLVKFLYIDPYESQKRKKERETKFGSDDK